jgi:hypothetical protein
VVDKAASETYTAVPPSRIKRGTLLSCQQQTEFSHTKTTRQQKRIPTFGINYADFYLEHMANI